MHPKYNRFAVRNTYYWDWFALFMQRNKAPYVLFRIHPPLPTSPQDICTITDAHLPHRKGIIYTGQSDLDWMRDSIVCNASWFNGEIPYHGWEGEWENDPLTDTPICKKRPARGVKKTLQMLLHFGCLLPNEEVSKLLGDDSRRFVPEEYGFLRLVV